MEKKKSEGIKGQARVGKLIIDYSFKKLSFGEELGEQTRVSVGNPFRHSDSAVKPSFLAGRLEKPSKLFICRDLALWFEDLQCGKHFICRFEEVRAFFSWHELRVGLFSGAGRISFSCCVLFPVGEICTIQITSSLAEA